MSDDARYNVLVMLIAAVILWAWLEFRWHRMKLAQLDYRLTWLDDAARPILARQAEAVEL